MMKKLLLCLVALLAIMGSWTTSSTWAADPQPESRWLALDKPRYGKTRIRVFDDPEDRSRRARLFSRKIGGRGELWLPLRRRTDVAFVTIDEIVTQKIKVLGMDGQWHWLRNRFLKPVFSGYATMDTTGGAPHFRFALPTGAPDEEPPPANDDPPPTGTGWLDLKNGDDVDLWVYISAVGSSADATASPRISGNTIQRVAVSGGFDYNLVAEWADGDISRDHTVIGAGPATVTAGSTTAVTFNKQ